MPDDGMRHELVRGELRTTSPTGVEHGGNEGGIYFRFVVHAREQRIGRVVVGEVGFRLSRDPDTVRAADVAFIRRERLPDGRLPRGYFEGPPDLAVEVVSPSDSAFDVEEKVRDWLDGGTRAVWVVYERGPSVTVHLADGTARSFGPDDEVEGGEAFPGFRMKVRDLLAAPEE